MQFLSKQFYVSPTLPGEMLTLFASSYGRLWMNRQLVTISALPEFRSSLFTTYIARNSWPLNSVGARGTDQCTVENPCMTCDFPEIDL